MVTAPSTSSQTRATKPPKLYIMPCICNKMNEWANVQVHIIIRSLIKNLTINKSNTTLAISRRISRPDPRVSSANIGRAACSICIAIGGLIVLSDCLRIIRHMQTLTKSKIVPDNGVQKQIRSHWSKESTTLTKTITTTHPAPPPNF